MKKRKKVGKIQDYFLTLREVRGPVMCLTNGEYCSVIEVTGTHLNLLDEEKRQDLYELYHRFFLSLDFPVEIIARVRKLNIEAYLRYVDPSPASSQQGAMLLPWQALARNHADFLRALTRQRGLFGRQFYLVLPAAADVDAVLPRRPRLHHPQERGEEALSLEQAVQLLRLRFETVAYHLQSIGLSCRLLTHLQLIQFYRSFFVPTPAPSPQQQSRKSTMLEDALAIDTIEVMRDAIDLEGHYIRVQAIETLPRLVSFGWLKNLIECDETFDLIHQIVPRPANDILPSLRRQQTHAQASLLFASGTGRIADPGATLARNDLEALVEQVTAGEQSMLDSSLHLVIRASSKEKLEQKTRRVSSRATTTFTHRPRTSSFEQARSFRSCLPGQMIGRDPQLLPSSAIASMIPFFEHFIFRPSETAILEGLTQHNEPVILDWWGDLPNANRLIIGPSGWGKSYKAKLDVLHLFYAYKRLAQQQQKQEDGFQILIVDPERETNREGFSLIETLGGESIRFSPGSMHRLNPLDLAVTSTTEERNEKEDLLANHIMRLHRIFDCMLAYNIEDTTSTLMPQEKSLLDASLYECYRRVGIYADRSTHQRPAPLLRDLLEILTSEICGPDTTNLAGRLRRYTHGSLSGLFSGHTNIRLDATVVQFDVKELESELRPIALLMISNFVWNVAFSSRIPRFLFIDEMATVGRYRAGQHFLEEMFQRARKHYLSVTGITQEPGHLTKSIVANCASQVLLHQDDTTIDTIQDLFKLSAREAQRVRGFDKGEALLLANGRRIQVRFLAAPQEDAFITTNRRQIAALEAAAMAARAAHQ
jgi:hypothetical protein